MLKALFLWLDQNPAAYWFATVPPTLLLVWWSVAAAWRELQGRPAAPERPLISAMLLLGVLLAWRWPFLLSATEYNPDESQFIAGAITLARDPVFWRSVEGTTSGPLNFYALLPLHWLGLPLDFFSARLTGLLLVWGSLLACHRALKCNFGAAIARLGILPTVVFFCTVYEWDFIHYSSEHVPLALIALAGSLLWCAAASTPSRLALLMAASFVAGLLPWAKLQATPIGLVLAVCAAASVLRPPLLQGIRQRWPAAAVVLGCAALPSVLALSLVAATGQFPTFTKTYLLQNLAYAGNAHSEEVGMLLVAAARETYLLPLCLLALAAPIVVAAITSWRRLDRLFAIAGTVLVVAVFCVLFPRRPFLHYTLLLIIPMTLWGGTALGEIQRFLATGRRRFLPGVLLLLLGAVVPLAARYASPRPAMVGQLAAHWRQPRSAVAQVLAAFSQPGDSLGVWGWAAYLYVETGLPQATLTSYSYWAIVESPLLEYRQDLFLAKIRQSRPAFFVDAVGPRAYYFNRRAEQAHEIVAGLRDFIGRDYVQLVDLGHARVFCRRDRLAAIWARRADLPDLIASGRPLPAATPRAEPWPSTSLPEKSIDDRSVRMMLPPSEVLWPLGGNEREAIVEFGYDPRAYTEGTGDGTEFTVAIVSRSNARSVIHRQLLDPVHQPAHRGQQKLRLTLPPLPPKARLAVRTAAGPANDNSWDWFYLSAVRFVRSPVFNYRQFPRFNRLPVAVVSDFGCSAEAFRPHRLRLHAPGALTFELKGHERWVRMAFGFLPNAYTSGGQTDGATFRLELRRGEAPAQPVFERRLQPMQVEADRGRQHTRTRLPDDLQAGDRLVLSIDPGATNSWDWTYVSDFLLE